MNLKKLGNLFLDKELIEEEVPKSIPTEPIIPVSTNSGGPLFFPTSDTVRTTPTASPTPTFTSNLNCEPHMGDILAKYEEGFASLNLPGYDFFEFFSNVP